MSRDQRPYADIELGCLGLLFFGGIVIVPVVMAVLGPWTAR